MHIKKETVDVLGRIIPGIQLEPALQSISEGWTDERGIAGLLAIAAQHHEDYTYAELASCAIENGYTHYPADLAGRRQPFRLQRMRYSVQIVADDDICRWIQVSAKSAGDAGQVALKDAADHGCVRPNANVYPVGTSTSSETPILRVG